MSVETSLTITDELISSSYALISLSITQKSLIPTNTIFIATVPHNYCNYNNN